MILIVISIVNITFCMIYWYIILERINFIQFCSKGELKGNIY